MAAASEIDWVCEHCGTRGRSTEPVDTVQCHICGEPVIPL